MRIERITVGYDVKRSHQYQSAGAAMSVEVTVGPDEKAEEVFALTMATIRPLVEAEADKGLNAALGL